MYVTDVDRYKNYKVCLARKINFAAQKVWEIPAFTTPQAIGCTLSGEMRELVRVWQA